MGRTNGLPLSGGVLGSLLRVLEREGIEISVASGTSIGALVGGCWAGGELDALESIARNMTVAGLMAYAGPKLSATGMFSGDRVVEHLTDLFGHTRLEDLRNKFAAVATDLATGEETVIRTGSVADAVRASIAVPGIFAASGGEGRLLVDGGLVNPVPVSIARELGADVVLAIDLLDDYWGAHDERRQSTGALGWMFGSGPGIVDTLTLSLHVMLRNLTRTHFQMYPPDAVIAPALGGFTPLEFHRADELIEHGERAAVAAMPEIHRAVAAGQPG